MHIVIAVGNNKYQKKYTNKEVDWNAIVSRNSNPVRTTETEDEYKSMSKAEKEKAKDVGGFVGAELKGGSRLKKNVNFRTLLTLDADNITDMDTFIRNCKRVLDGDAFIIYSTHSHRTDSPRCRLVAPFNRNVYGDEYEAVARKVASLIGIDEFDDTTYDINRMMYWASCPSNGDFVFEENVGNALDPDKYLNMYTDWKDASTWATSSKQSEVHRSRAEKEDPLTKKGVVGAFCRAYSISEAISEFLGDVYTETDREGRYDYKPGESYAGAVVFDDKFVYSFHATDPASEQMLNAFDLVRVHKFPNEDEKKSFAEMADFAGGLEKVRLVAAEDSLKEAAEDFESDNWCAGLEYDTRSMTLKNNLHNVMLILKNDPNLKGIVFNQLADGIEIREEVPWSHPGTYWRDADDAQLIAYLDKHYTMFGDRIFRTALAKVADDRAYHPIKDMFESLPEWDGEKRVETLLIDYLGAEDNKYVRTVIKKELCAAYMRVYHPGIKFDNMLVIVGDQGIGKSTLIAKLGGIWFSDSVALSDMNDKTAAEKLQGYWLMEIGELAGMRKADIDKVKAFISRQDDKFRASFGRHVTPHPRQCVFFGTTNNKDGYLRDITGNRRFWNVSVNGNGKYSPWDLTQEIIDQIWAEVKEIVKAGEDLYLSPELEEVARTEQRFAMEPDEREGLVRNYLDTPLPEKWYEWKILDRKGYFHSEFDKKDEPPTVIREHVSNMEIWCECFGNRKADLKLGDSYSISAIMAKIEGWERTDRKIKDDEYGVQRVYERTS